MGAVVQQHRLLAAGGTELAAAQAVVDGDRQRHLVAAPAAGGRR